MAKKPSLESLLINIAEKTEKHYDDLDKRLDNIEKVMIAQEINLKQHMQRSDHLESLISTIQKDDLLPLQKHVQTVEGVFKFLGILSLIVGIATGVASFFHLI